MADNDSVGKIGLDLEIQDGDIEKQIEEMASSIGNKISKSLEGITGKFDFSSLTNGITESLNRAFNSIDETINSNLEKSKQNILKTIEEIKERALDCIKSIIAKAKKINIPLNFEPVKNIVMPSQTTGKAVSSRGPPKSNTVNLESIKAQIDNLSNSLDITNRKIEQQQEKLAGLRQTYNSTFNQARKNKIEEQILKTEAAINKLTAQSDKTGFKLADLDAEFERLSSASRNSSVGVSEANNSIKRTANVANNASRSLRNANNNSRQFRNNMNGARSATGMFIDSMFKWGIVFPIIMKGISAVGSYIGSALMTNAQFANSLAQVRTNLMVAFMPIYQAVLPALNALMSGLATVTAYIAAFISALFGKTYKSSFGAAKSMNSSIAAMKVMEKQGHKTSGAVDKIGDSASKAKKKIQGALAGFDEINKLSMPKDTDKTPKSPSGGGGGAGSIPMVTPGIDLGPTGVAMQKINAMVEKLKDIISKIFQPFKNAWAREGAATIASIKYALHGIWELIRSIGHSFLEVWTNGTGEAILVVILQILQNIFNIIGDIGITFANAWNAGGIGTAIVQTLANAFLNVLTLIKHMGDSLRQVWGEVGPGVAKTFMAILHSTAKVLENLTQKLVYVWDNGGSHLFQGFIRLGAKIFELAGYIYTQFVVPMVNWFVNNIAPVIAIVADKVGIILDAFSGLITWLMGSGKPVLDIIITAFGLLGGSIGAVKIGTSLATKAFKLFGNIMSIIKVGSGLLGTAIAFLSNPIGIAIVAIGAIIAIGVSLYKNWDVIKAKAKVVWAKIKQIFYEFKVWLQGVFQRDWSKSFGVLGNLLNAFLRNVSNIFGGVRSVFNGIINFVAGIFTGNWRRAWNGVKEIFRGAFQALGGIAKAPLNAVIGLVNMAIDGLNTISFTAPSWVPFVGGQHFGVNIPKMPYLAKGGIVDKPTQAVVGEAGTEAVVPLENNTGGLDLLANKLTERISNILSTSSSILQQPDLTMLGQNSNIDNQNTNYSNYLEKLKEAIIEAIKESKEDKEYKDGGNNDRDMGDIILKVGETEFGKIAIRTINKVNRQAGEQLLKI
ncbi:membrane protein [Clostridium sp. Ade.TY]|uniref:membrane protein n=1 Tax=Clostridium sp. Ade.TY TaxID=1391647 RepID=UPI0003F4F1A1|nr:membrane protein [Clostridium sp. Ade.TY]